MEKRSGSLVRGMLKKKGGGHGLFSFRNGMETLPRRLAERLEIDVRLNHPVTKITCYEDHVEVEAGGATFAASHLYSTLPAHVLASLVDIPIVEARSIGVVSLGYRKQVLDKEGFGYLIPSKEEEAILGAVWDSSVFPQQNRSPEETRITVMMEEPDVTKAQEALQRHLGITAEPQATSCLLAKGAIPQYTLGHAERVKRTEQDLPSRIMALGSSYYGVSVNDCVAHTSSV